MSAPRCITCGHMVLFHGAGRCTPPFSDECQCPATAEAVFGPAEGETA